MERKRCVSLQKQDKIKRGNNVEEMKSTFTHWANLEAARDDSSMNLNYVTLVGPTGLIVGVHQNVGDQPT